MCFRSKAATKIQSRYRSHLIRNLTKTLLSTNAKTNALQNRLQTQETVDKIRSNEKEKIKLSENLMDLLLKLDSVSGAFDENVRDARRIVSRRIVELLEILDWVVAENVDFGGAVGFDEICEKIMVDEEIKGGGVGKNSEEASCVCKEFRCWEEFVRLM